MDVTGVDPRLAATLRRELATRAGMALAEAPLREDLRRLWKLGVIADASVLVAGDDVTFAVVPRPTITHVVGKGGDALAQARFRQLVAAPFEPARIRRMTDALAESYVREGRLDAHVEARQRVHAAGVEVCVATNPGPRVTIGKLEFPGARAVPARRLRAVLHGKEANVNRIGGAFDPAALEFDELFLQSEYWERGHLDVRIGKVVVQRRGNRLHVAIPIDEGPRYRVGTVRAPVAVPLRPGDVFKRSQVVVAMEHLRTTLRPYDVIPVTRIDKDARRIDITFDIEWRYPWDALRFWLSPSR